MTYSLIALRCSSNEFSDSHNKNKLKGLPMVRVSVRVPVSQRIRNPKRRLGSNPLERLPLIFFGMRREPVQNEPYDALDDNDRLGFLSVPGKFLEDLEDGVIPVGHAIQICMRNPDLTVSCHACRFGKYFRGSLSFAGHHGIHYAAETVVSWHHMRPVASEFPTRMEALRSREAIGQAPSQEARDWYETRPGVSEAKKVQEQAMVNTELRLRLRVWEDPEFRYERTLTGQLVHNSGSMFAWLIADNHDHYIWVPLESIVRAGRRQSLAGERTLTIGRTPARSASRADAATSVRPVAAAGG